MINIIEMMKSKFEAFAFQEGLELVLEKGDNLKYKSSSPLIQMDRDRIFSAMKDAIAKGLEEAGIDYAISSLGIIIRKTSQNPRILVTVDADTEFIYFLIR